MFTDVQTTSTLLNDNQVFWMLENNSKSKLKYWIWLPETMVTISFIFKCLLSCQFVMKLIIDSNKCKRQIVTYILQVKQQFENVCSSVITTFTSNQFSCSMHAILVQQTSHLWSLHVYILMHMHWGPEQIKH